MAGLIKKQILKHLSRSVSAKRRAVEKIKDDGTGRFQLSDAQPAELSHKQSVIFKDPLHNSCSYFIPLRVGKDARFLCCQSQVSSLGGVWQLLEGLT